MKGQIQRHGIIYGVGINLAERVCNDFTAVPSRLLKRNKQSLQQTLSVRSLGNSQRGWWCLDLDLCLSNSWFACYKHMQYIGGFLSCENVSLWSISGRIQVHRKSDGKIDRCKNLRCQSRYHNSPHCWQYSLPLQSLFSHVCFIYFIFKILFPSQFQEVKFFDSLLC